MDIEATFLGEHWTVIGPLPNVLHALSVLQNVAPNVACLDMTLNGAPSTPIAEMLQKLGIPFVVLTGYRGRDVTHAAYKSAPVLQKPFIATELVSVVKELLRREAAAPDPDARLLT